MMLCTGCGREIKDDSFFCEYCGRIVGKTTEKFCKSCGNKIDSGSSFCIYCGDKVNFKEEKKTVADKKADMNGTYMDKTFVPTNASEKTNTNFKKRISTRTIALTAIALIIIGLLTFFLYMYDYTQETNVVNFPTDVTEDNKEKFVNGIHYKLINTKLVISGEGETDKNTIDSFSGNSYDTVVFESGNIDIADDTFSGFSNIKNIELKNVVGTIGARAFKGCGFRLIAIGKSIEEIKEEAFADCKISEVYLNNPQIRANLNTRYDFGRLFENASTIAIYYSTSQSADEDFTLDESGWGQYLKDNEEYHKLKSIASSGATLTSRNYNLWAHAIRPGFFHFCYESDLTSDDTYAGAKDYIPETNTLILYDNSNQ